jgi:hypothetical protein
MEMNMSKIYPAVACLMLALAFTQSMPAVAQSRLPLGLMPSNPLPTPQFNSPGPQIAIPQPPVPRSPLPTDPPMGPLGLR